MRAKVIAPPSGNLARGPFRLAAVFRWTAGLLLAASPAQPAPAGAQEPPPSPAPRTFDVAASRYRFEPSVLEVEEGDRVVITLRSADVEHGFGIKKLGVAAKVPEGGAPVVVEFVAARAGRFTIACTEFCGEGHPGMRAELLVRPRGGGAGPGDPPLPPDPAEPDFALVNLATALPVPRGGFVFRILHRFSRPLGRGGFGDLAADLFGLDAGGDVGLEVRYGLPARVQAGVYRTSGDRTIVLFTQADLIRQGGSPLDVSGLLSVEGIDNFHEQYSPRVGVLVSRRFANRGAVYALPSWVGNSNLFDLEGDDHTFLLGLGARLRVFGAVSLTGEVHPRLGGFSGGPNSGMAAAFGVERRVGGHSFQINFVNDLGSTPAQVARGRRTDEWYVGFNISRKFY